MTRKKVIKQGSAFVSQMKSIGLCRISASTTTDHIPNIQNILLKEYELCFTRACSMYDLTNEIIKLYTTIYFAVMSVFGFAFQSIPVTLFGDTKLLPICMLSCLIVYGYVTMFMHIATWSARNNYRKRRSYLLQHLLGVSDQDCLKKALLIIFVFQGM